MNDDHIPVPSEHSPRKISMQQVEDSLTIMEADNPDAWIQAMNGSGLMEIKQ